MSRSVEEWIGKTDDAAIPPRVKIRIFDRYDKKCFNCGRSIVGKLRPVFDHVVALINGGQNREGNIQVLCSECHAPKTRTDVAEKSAIYKKRAKRLRFTKRKLIPGSRGSGFRKKMDGTVVREE